MQLEIRVKKDGKWQGMTAEECGKTLDDRVLNLTNCEAHNDN